MAAPQQQPQTVVTTEFAASQPPPVYYQQPGTLQAPGQQGMAMQPMPMGAPGQPVPGQQPIMHMQPMMQPGQQPMMQPMMTPNAAPQQVGMGMVGGGVMTNGMMSMNQHQSELGKVSVFNSDVFMKKLPKAQPFQKDFQCSGMAMITCPAPHAMIFFPCVNESLAISEVWNRLNQVITYGGT